MSCTCCIQLQSTDGIDTPQSTPVQSEPMATITSLSSGTLWNYFKGFLTEEGDAFGGFISGEEGSLVSSAAWSALATGLKGNYTYFVGKVAAKMKTTAIVVGLVLAAGLLAMLGFLMWFSRGAAKSYGAAAGAS